MLYTKQGDKGTTKTLHTNTRMPKNSCLAEALGTVDECNSLFGLVRSQYEESLLLVNGAPITQVIEVLQQHLFRLQAELAGGGKTEPLGESEVVYLEELTDTMEQQIPEINSFFLPGATELSGWCDYTRTVVRRMERTLVTLSEANETLIGEQSLAYSNRLSSVWYALARYTNYQLEAEETAPSY